MTNKDEVVAWFKERGIILDPSYIVHWQVDKGILFFRVVIPDGIEVNGIKSTKSEHVDKCLIDSTEFKLLP